MNSDQEQGVFLVVWALMLVALVTMVAVVVDLGGLRSDRRANRSVADAAATAGAMSFNDGTPLDACNVAWDYATSNLGVSASSPCTTGSSPFTTAACTNSSVMEVTGTAGNYTITITNPVLNTNTSLLDADAVGDNPTQSVNSLDGEPCDRLGVRIRETRDSFFGGIVGADSATSGAHSVALYRRERGPGGDIPALVALEPTDCYTIGGGVTNNGLIHAFAHEEAFDKPGLIYADSTGTTNCGQSGAAVFNAKSEGRTIADDSINGNPGELGYFSSLDQAFSSQGTFTGTKLKLPAQITRQPVDRLYHCSNVTPVPDDCTTGISGTDDIDRLKQAYGTGIPTSGLFNSLGPFKVFPDPALGQTCDAPLSTYTPGNWYIDCPNFTVQGQTVDFQAGDIIFAGNLLLGSTSLLRINSNNTDDSVVMIRGNSPGLTTSSNTWEIEWKRAFLFMYNSTCSTANVQCGTANISNGSGSWTAPTTSIFEDLIYWSETTQSHTFQGTPRFTWEGIFFAGNSLFDLQGNVTVDARNVQLWVDKVQVPNKSASLLLRPDPEKAASVTKPSTALIR